MRIACWIPKATDTHSEHVTMIVKECLFNFTLCTHCLYCYRTVRNIALSCEQDLQILSCAEFFIVYPCASLQIVKQIKFWAMSVHQQWHGCWTRLMYRTSWPWQRTGSSDLQLRSAAVINVEWCAVCVCVCVEGGRVFWHKRNDYFWRQRRSNR